MEPRAIKELEQGGIHSVFLLPKEKHYPPTPSTTTTIMSQTPLPAPTPALDLANIQGDIVVGLPKKAEVYYFFQITNPTKFRKDFTNFVPFVKTAKQVVEDRKKIDEHKKRGGQGLIPLAGVNIAFSHLGFAKLGIDDSTLVSGDGDPFKVGQFKDALQNLGDRPKEIQSGAQVPDWEDEFLKPIHGLILIAAESRDHAGKELDKLKQVFGVDTPTSSIRKIDAIWGDVRPGKESAHEHFGFLDGISNPSITGFDTVVLPGQGAVRPGIIVTGHEGDPIPNRAPWAVDGSFLVFRYLFQQVPEFDDFLKKNPVKSGNMTDEQGSELLGARMVGRWKSGAPIDITPFKDDPVLALDPQRNNNFQFKDQQNSQQRCPFAAHVRKTRPRDDLETVFPGSTETRRIARRGIQFGPEVTAHEKLSKKTEEERGLLFVCYQSSISNGFQFMQHSWANNITFPFVETQPEDPGFDPLIGQAPEGVARKMSGLDPKNAQRELTFPDFIIPRGGEYFFSPSIKALKETIAVV